MQDSKEENRGFRAKIRRLLNYNLYEPFAKQLCDELNAMGVQAKVSDDQYKVVDIVGGQIGWINWKIPMSGDEEITIEYVVPDSRNIPIIVIQPQFIRTIPVIGGIKEIRWKQPQLYGRIKKKVRWNWNDAQGKKITNILNNEDSINSFFRVNSNGTTIQSFPDKGYWIIDEKRWNFKSPMINWLTWNTYNRIAKILLEVPIVE